MRASFEPGPGTVCDHRPSSAGRLPTVFKSVIGVFQRRPHGAPHGPTPPPCSLPWLPALHELLTAASVGRSVHTLRPFPQTCAHPATSSPSMRVCLCVQISPFL